MNGLYLSILLIPIGAAMLKNERPIRHNAMIEYSFPR